LFIKNLQNESRRPQPESHFRYLRSNVYFTEFFEVNVSACFSSLIPSVLSLLRSKRSQSMFFRVCGTSQARFIPRLSAFTLILATIKEGIID
jgi:hypothetical protein